MADATILHADLDAFYASVEQLLEPSLRGRPIAGRRRGRARGLLRGQGFRRSRRHVEDGRRASCARISIFVGGHFSDYQRLGDAAIAVVGDFTPLVERISIDEAFADVAGSHPSVRNARRNRRARSGAGCAPSSALRSRWVSPAPSIWPRSLRRSPSPTG